jgi:AcrR family transcriptional regulator
MNAEVKATAKLQRKGARTREAILDAAEREFSAHGFDGVTMRQIADSSRQALGVLTYHFPSKEMLFEAVVVRRADDLTARRRAALEQLINPKLEQVLDAFLGPFLERIENGGPGWKHYAQLLAHIAQEARWAPLVSRLFGESARTFIRHMRAAEPGLTLYAATHGYVHLISVMVGLFASTGLIDRLSEGKLTSEDFRANCQRAVRFVAGGVRALAAGEQDEIAPIAKG